MTYTDRNVSMSSQKKQKTAARARRQCSITDSNYCFSPSFAYERRGGGGGGGGERGQTHSFI